MLYHTALTITVSILAWWTRWSSHGPLVAHLCWYDTHRFNVKVSIASSAPLIHRHVGRQCANKHAHSSTYLYLHHPSFPATDYCHIALVPTSCTNHFRANHMWSSPHLFPATNFPNNTVWHYFGRSETFAHVFPSHSPEHWQILPFMRTSAMPIPLTDL